MQRNRGGQEGEVCWWDDIKKRENPRRNLKFHPCPPPTSAPLARKINALAVQIIHIGPNSRTCSNFIKTRPSDYFTKMWFSFKHYACLEHCMITAST